MLISSIDNSKLKHTKSLLDNHRARKKAKQTVLEGIHLLTSYQHANLLPMQLWLTEDASSHSEVAPLLQHWQAVPTYHLKNNLYKQLRSIGDGVDVLAVIQQPQYQLTPIYDDALILNNVQDAGNVGTLLRTASAVGIKHILSTHGTASLWSPKCLRAGMGAHFSLNIYENLTEAQIFDALKIPMLATSSHTSALIYQQNLTQPIAWVMGHEGQGVNAQFMAKAQPIALPQRSQESLNVAIAGALCMYEMLRQREYATL